MEVIHCVGGEETHAKSRDYEVMTGQAVRHGKYEHTVIQQEVFLRL